MELSALDFPFESQLNSDFGMSWQMLAFTMLASYLLCHVIAAVYTWTFRGLSYSRGFVVSLVLTGLIASILMLAIGDNLARGLGMLGTLAMIRFRSSLRDIRDMMFIFASLSIGIAVGVQSYVVGLMGTLIFCFTVIHLTFSPFGLKRQFDGLLRLNTAADPHVDEQLKAKLKEHCTNYVLVNLREISQGERLEQAYQIKLRDPSYRTHLVSSLRIIKDISDVSLLMQDPALEV